MAKSDFPRTPLEVGDVDLVNPRLLGEVDLPPTLLFSELPDSFAKLDAHIRGHSSSIDLVEALYLVDALSVGDRGKSEDLSSARRIWRDLVADFEDPEGREEVSYRAKIL